MKKHNKKAYISKKQIISIVVIVLLSGCSAMQKKANGSHFSFGSNNNSEASIWLEKITVDNKWNAPSTGTLGCGGSNINGAPRVGSVSSKTIAPQESIVVQWYSWKEMARMVTKIDLPDNKIINKLLLNPPWPKNKYGLDKSYFIIDVRNDNKVLVKLADTSSPKSQKEVMILAEGKGVKTDDIVTRYTNFKKGENYTLDCVSKRRRLKELGYYTTPIEFYDRWYPGASQNKEDKDE